MSSKTFSANFVSESERKSVTRKKPVNVKVNFPLFDATAVKEGTILHDGQQVSTFRLSKFRNCCGAIEIGHLNQEMTKPVMTKALKEIAKEIKRRNAEVEDYTWKGAFVIATASVDQDKYREALEAAGYEESGYGHNGTTGRRVYLFTKFIKPSE